MSLVADFREPITRLARRLLRRPDRADDVVQDVFVAALAGARRFRGDASVATWLTRIAIHACRRANRRAAVEAGLRRLMSSGTGSAGSQVFSHDGRAPASSMDELQVVREAVRSLPPKYREVVVLRYLEGCAVGHVADILSMTRNAVEQRLTRARRRLSADLRERGIDHADA